MAGAMVLGIAAGAIATAPALASDVTGNVAFATGIAVQCTPTGVEVLHPTTCRATDQALGVAVFTTNARGQFNPGSCALRRTTQGGAASCEVTYTPTQIGSGQHTITATYLGSGVARGTTTVAVHDATPPSTPAVAYQLNPAHSGAVGDAIASSPTRRWSVDLGGAISYPLIVDGRVFVTVADSTGGGSKLYALDGGTGAVAWGPIELGGPYPWSGIAYDRGDVFAVSSGGLLQAFVAATGAPAWSRQLPGQFLFSSPPTASGGVVYTSGAGSGGTVYAVDEATHAISWTAAVENGDDSSPAVSPTGVYVSYACGQTYDFRPASGALVWHRDTSCEGGGGKTPVLAGGRLYVRDFDFPAILDATTGSVLGPLAAAGPAPAVDATSSYMLSGSALTAASVPSGATRWTFSGDGQLSSAPLVAGQTVVIGSRSGTLYGLSAATGAVAWSADVGMPIPGPDEQNLSQPLTGLASSGGLVVVPAGPQLVAYR